MDPRDEMIIIQEVVGGRKSRIKEKSPRTGKRKIKEHEPNIKCSHGLENSSSNPKAKGSKQCKVAELSFDDISVFHNKFKTLCKIDQDKLLIKFMTITSPKRRVVNTEFKYSFRKTDGQKIIPVCASSFQGITGFSKDRLSLLANRFYSTGQSPRENRGGNTAGKNHENLTIAVKNDIKLYKCRESHYTRGKSSRGYLPPELSVKKMWTNFCEKRNNLGLLETCSLSKYKHIFYRYFNLSFRTPHTDSCSTCKIGLFQIKAETDLVKKNELRTQYRLHKLRADKFYKIMKDDNPEVIKICFDLQQNQPLPKLSVSEVFYTRQVWLYNLCVMIHSKTQEIKDISFYTWLETQLSRGCNQVASVLLDFLFNLEKNPPLMPRPPFICFLILVPVRTRIAL
ncbi:hypothetical protein ANN_26969 [Periplaneta americana]|uniref:Uncharacterized protein n=1 Tax=Periplaneta americana TaxID=6978 RepID=A0ABQ8RWU7_PERAM|nr:hypothetical protein ANN_26969 [Periplaneta americana]